MTAATAPPALQAVHITKRFGEVRALHDVSLDVAAGRILGLVGQNGAGKSTLMKILDGQYPHGSYEGRVLVGGTEVALRSPRHAAAYGIGIVPQETSVIDSLSVGENLHLGRYGTRGLLTERRMQRRAQEFLDRIELPLDARLPVAALTTSEKQLVMIARTVFAQPHILILDEPTTALTDAEAERLFRVVRRLSDDGVSSVLISHRLDEVFELSDDIAVLRDGELVDEMSRAEFDRVRVVDGIAGRRLGELFPPRRADAGDDVVLRVANLGVPDPRRSERLVVDDVSFTVRAGEIVGIGGALGSGRSEVLEAIYGLLPASTGKIEVRGVPHVSGSPEQSIAAGVAAVPEDRKHDGLFLNGTVQENLTISVLRSLAGRLLVSPGATRRAAEDDVRRFAIKTGGVDAPITSLSGGNQQKVLIARAMSTDPTVLLLDEPTKGVDVGARAEIYQLVRTAADDGVAVVLVSSEVPELLGLCDRVLVLSKGRAVSELDARSTRPEDLTLAAMSGHLATEPPS